MRELVDAIEVAVMGGPANSEPAFAKVNLALHVLSRRADGYHLLDSLVAFADLGERIEAAPSPDAEPSLSLGGPFANELDLIAPPQDNLVVKAAELLGNASRKRKKHPPTDLHLTKVIPIAAGLGGGSADAAATLRLLNRYWEIGLPEAELRTLGLRLGADVPMCLASRPTRAKGIGEEITSLSGMPRLPLVLVNPGIPISTAAVYAGLERRERRPIPPLPARFDSVIPFVIWLRQTRNDLTEPVRRLTGLVDNAVKVLSSEPDCLLARMSGSGATVFGIFPTIARAMLAADDLRRRRPNWWVTATETVGS